jgi:hypothetical protein
VSSLHFSGKAKYLPNELSLPLFTGVRGETVWKIAVRPLEGALLAPGGADRLLFAPSWRPYSSRFGTHSEFPNSFGRLILRSSHSPGPNTYECPGRISASEGYYPYFLIIPFRERCPWVGFLALSDRGYVGVLV